VEAFSKLALLSTSFFLREKWPKNESRRSDLSEPFAVAHAGALTIRQHAVSIFPWRATGAFLFAVYPALARL
jgi:hypothetical protein